MPERCRKCNGIIKLYTDDGYLDNYLDLVQEMVPTTSPSIELNMCSKCYKVLYNNNGDDE